MKRYCTTLVLLAALIGVGTAQNFFNQSDFQWLAVPDHADWTYRVGDTATIDVQVLHDGMPLDGLTIDYTIAGDCLDPDEQGAVTLQGGHAQIRIPSGSSPSFRDCRMRIELQPTVVSNHLKVGFSPDEIRPMVELPDDFDAFWAATLASLADSEPKAWARPEPKYATPKVDCWLVKLQGWGGHRLYGYLTAPRGVLALTAEPRGADDFVPVAQLFTPGPAARTEGGYPVVVNPPGAGIKAMSPVKTLFYAEQGIIRLDLEIHGLDPDLPAQHYEDISRTFGAHHASGYLANGITNRETYYMRRVYASLLRAVDLVCALPVWDGKRVLVQGNSQGGALSLVLAALDPRVSAIAIAHPALADMAAYSQPGRTGGYPHFGRKYQGVTLTPEVVRTLQYYDVVNFARRVSCPVFMTYGYNDNVCPPTTSAAVWNVLSCPKERIVTPINEHWITNSMRRVQMGFLLDPATE